MPPADTEYLFTSVLFPLCIDQGSILDTKVDVLNHRLRGLCDNVDIDRETFDEKEMVFSIRGEKRCVSVG